MKYAVKFDDELIDTIIGLHCVFNDIDKVRFWLNARNPNLGNLRPAYLFHVGRGKVVQEFVTQALDENNEAIIKNGR